MRLSFVARPFQQLFAISLIVGVMATPLQALAHHGGEGESGTLATGAMGGATGGALLTAGSQPLKTSQLMDGLWANVLLSIALQRDAEVQHIHRWSRRLNGATTVAIMGVSGLGLAQSIHALNSIEPKTYDVSGHDDHSHVHIPAASRVLSTMGIIGSSVTLGTLGVRVVGGHILGKKMTRRQTELQNQLLAALSTKNEAELATLVGPQTASEYLSLTSAHP
jgi:hypothetical protein